jgi:hypothetical protein
MHEHKECEHELKYCKVCKVVYCELCNKQWYSYEVTVSTPFIVSPYITYDNGGTDLYPIDVTPKITCIHNS